MHEEVTAVGCFIQKPDAVAKKELGLDVVELPRLPPDKRHRYARDAEAALAQTRRGEEFDASVAKGGAEGTSNSHGGVPDFLSVGADREVESLRGLLDRCFEQK